MFNARWQPKLILLILLINYKSRTRDKMPNCLCSHMPAQVLEEMATSTHLDALMMRMVHDALWQSFEDKKHVFHATASVPPLVWMWNDSLKLWPSFIYLHPDSDVTRRLYCNCRKRQSKFYYNCRKRQSECQL